MSEVEQAGMAVLSGSIDMPYVDVPHEEAVTGGLNLGHELSVMWPAEFGAGSGNPGKDLAS
jgi:hypothetical protein